MQKFYEVFCRVCQEEFESSTWIATQQGGRVCVCPECLSGIPISPETPSKFSAKREKENTEMHLVLYNQEYSSI